MQRISVVGSPGSGKTTLARELARRLQLDHVELDGIFHQPGWTELPVEEFRRRVEAATATSRWVACGNYSAVRDIVWQRADTVVWIDLPRRVVMRRVVRRTVARVVLRRELWNGNRERMSNLTSLDPEKSIIAWAWTTHASATARYEAASTDPAWARLRFVRLRTPRAVAAFVADPLGSGD